MGNCCSAEAAAGDCRQGPPPAAARPLQQAPAGHANRAAARPSRAPLGGNKLVRRSLPGPAAGAASGHRAASSGATAAATRATVQSFSICAVCRAIPFALLPAEDEPGYPHHRSVAALRQSAKECMLCLLILASVVSHRKDINEKLNGIAGRGGWIMCSGNKLPDGRMRMEQTLEGAFAPGSTVWAGRGSGQEAESSALAKTFSFESDEDVRPWLYGNWWTYGTPAPANLLIGLGVRVGRTGAIEDGEGNKKTKSSNGIMRDNVTFRGTHLRIRTRMDSAMASYIPGRLRSMDSSSSTAFQRIRGWLSACDTSHQCQPRNTPLPTRALDVSVAGTDFIRLVQGQGTVAPFVALSHRWGTSHRLTLTKENMSELQLGIRLSEIPQTFRDAVLIARTLGIRYLWIDSLCIIQDDHDDWEREAAQMAKVYASSYLSIAAAFSEDDSSGCFPPWSMRSTTLAVPPEVRSLGLSPMHANTAPVVESAGSATADPRALAYGAQSQFALIKYPGPDATAELSISLEWMPTSLKGKPQNYVIPHFGQPVDEPGTQPLNMRGWTLQERLLSPRTLHFCPDQMYWECNVCQLSEDGARISSRQYNLDQLVATQRLPLDQHGIDERSGISFIEGYPPTSAMAKPTGRWNGGWLSTIENYSQRQLTVPDDKLPALSGLARRLASLTGDVYYAGLWRNHIVEDLAWRVYTRVENRAQAPGGFAHHLGEKLCEPSRPPTYRAPSWSWASLDAHVLFVPLDFGRIQTEFVDARVVPSGSDPFGRASGGWMKLRGPLMSVRQAPPGYKPSPQDPLGFGVPYQMHTASGVSEGEAFFDLELRTECLALFLDPSNALLLVPSDGAPGAHTRVGIAKFLRTSHQRTILPKYSLEGGLQRVPYGPIGAGEIKVDVTIV